MADRRHVDAHLVGPAGLQPAFDQRRVAAAASSRFQWVTARLPRPSLDDRDLLAVGGRAGERGVDRARRRPRHARRRSPGSARSIAVRRRTACASPSCATSVLATTSSPDVSLSMRWTMPGRATPPMPDRLAAAMVEQGVDQRPVAVAGGRMDDQPGGLVDRPADARPRRRSAAGCPAARYAPARARGPPA